MSEPGMMEMMKQARDLQRRMGKAQKKVAKTEITATAGGGMVTVVISGDMQVRRITFEPSLVEGGDIRMIQDLTTSAVNAAIQKAQDLMNEEMKQVTGGVKVPGLF